MKLTIIIFIFIIMEACSSSDVTITDAQVTFPGNSEEEINRAAENEVNQLTVLRQRIDERGIKCDCATTYNKIHPCFQYCMDFTNLSNKKSCSFCKLSMEKRCVNACIIAQVADPFIQCALFFNNNSVSGNNSEREELMDKIPQCKHWGNFNAFYPCYIEDANSVNFEFPLSDDFDNNIQGIDDDFSEGACYDINNRIAVSAGSQAP